MISDFQFHFSLVYCRQLIYNYPEQLFADAGIMAIEHADFEGIERLALVLGKSRVARGRREKGEGKGGKRGREEGERGEGRMCMVLWPLNMLTLKALRD